MDEEKGRILYVIDFLVAIFIVLIGVFVILFGVSFMDFFTNVSAQNPSSVEVYDWIIKIPWIIITSGIVVVLYGVKRVIKNIRNL